MLAQINAAAAPVGYECLFSGLLIPVTITAVTSEQVIARDNDGVTYLVPVANAWAYFWKEE